MIVNRLIVRRLEAKSVSIERNPMKQGKDINELAAQIIEEAGKKKDFIVNTASLEYHVSAEGPKLKFPTDDGDMWTGVSANANKQVAARVGIPATYFNKMLTDSPESMELAATNVNHWFQNKPEDRMIRTLDGDARAVLSSKYRRIDNYDVCEALLPIVQDSRYGVVFKSQEVTPDRMYIKMTTDKLRGEIKRGDEVCGGIMIQNSEVGLGSLKLTPFIERLVCTNGMITTLGLDGENLGYNRRHIGSKNEANDYYATLLSDRTRTLQDAAVLSEVKDVVAAILSEGTFNLVMDKLRGATRRILNGDPQKAVELVQSTFSLPDEAKGGILFHLTGGQDLSVYGMSQAITRYSQDIESYAEATEYEELGWKVLDMKSFDYQPA